MTDVHIRAMAVLDRKYAITLGCIHQPNRPIRDWRWEWEWGGTSALVCFFLQREQGFKVHRRLPLCDSTQVLRDFGAGPVDQLGEWTVMTLLQQLARRACKKHNRPLADSAPRDYTDSACSLSRAMKWDHLCHNFI